MTRTWPTKNGVCRPSVITLYEHFIVSAGGNVAGVYNAEDDNRDIETDTDFYSAG